MADKQCFNGAQVLGREAEQGAGGEAAFEAAGAAGTAFLVLGGDVGDEAAHKADEGGAVGVAGFEEAVAVEFAEHEAAARAGDGDAAAVVAAHFGCAVFPAHFQFGVVAFGVAAGGFDAAEFFEFAADDKGLVLAIMACAVCWKKVLMENPLNVLVGI